MILTHDSIDKFLDSMCVNGAPNNTIRAYRADLRGLLTAVGENPTEVDVAHWLNSVKGSYAPKTVQRKLGTFRVYSAWVGDRILGAYKAPTPAPPDPHPLPEGIAGVKAMIAQSHNIYDRALVGLCGLCGLRIHEAITVSHENVDTTEMQLRFVGKGSKERIVPISAAAWAVIEPAWKFSRAYGGGLVELTERTARRRITDLARRAGLSRHVSSHDLRATFGTAVYAKTKNLRVVQDLLGHSNSHTTEVYTGVAAAEKRSAVEAI